MVDAAFFPIGARLSNPANLCLLPITRTAPVAVRAAAFVHAADVRVLSLRAFPRFESLAVVCDFSEPDRDPHRLGHALA